jgi:hypothetical protein
MVVCGRRGSWGSLCIGMYISTYLKEITNERGDNPAWQRGRPCESWKARPGQPGGIVDAVFQDLKKLQALPQVRSNALQVILFSDACVLWRSKSSGGWGCCVLRRLSLLRGAVVLKSARCAPVETHADCWAHLGMTSIRRAVKS